MSASVIACGGMDDRPGGAAWELDRAVEQPLDGDGDATTTGELDDDLPGSSGDTGDTGEPADAEPEPDPNACDWVRSANIGEHTLNVREMPNVSASVLGQLYPSQVVPALGETTGDTVTDGALGQSTDVWIEIELGTKIGYVTALYVECTGEPEFGEWVWPVPLTHSLIQDYGNPIAYQSCGFHTGLDIAGDIGDPILAAGAGEVVHVGPMWLSGAGQGRGPYAIIIRHGDGELYSTYGHNDAALVELGDIVAAGDPIAEMGTLGYSGGPHLHLEFLDGTAFTGDWAMPFENACAYYVDPKIYVQP